MAETAGRSQVLIQSDPDYTLPLSLEKSDPCRKRPIERGAARTDRSIGPAHVLADDDRPQVGIGSQHQPMHAADCMKACVIDPSPFGVAPFDNEFVRILARFNGHGDVSAVQLQQTGTQKRTVGEVCTARWQGRLPVCATMRFHYSRRPRYVPS